MLVHLINVMVLIQVILSLGSWLQQLF